jgi:hypothetical protein
MKMPAWVLVGSKNKSFYETLVPAGQAAALFRNSPMGFCSFSKQRSPAETLIWQILDPEMQPIESL